MKGAGWIGIAMIGAGVLLLWSGYTGVDPLEALRSILRNEPMPNQDPMLEATQGSSGKSGFDVDENGDTVGAAGEGASGTNGGGW